MVLSAIEHYEYCPRQCALIHCDGVWTENLHTTKGQIAHRRTDNPDESRVERGRQVLRGVRLWSDTHSLSGRADRIEIHTDGTVVPVEHKSGRRHGKTADLQLCAQVLCLEEMLGIEIRYGYLWYDGTRKRHKVAITDNLRDLTLRRIDEIRQMLESSALPAAPNDSRCDQCQLHHHCLPTVTSQTRKVSQLVKELLNE